MKLLAKKYIYLAFLQSFERGRYAITHKIHYIAKLVIPFYVRLPDSRTENNRRTDRNDEHLDDENEVPDNFFAKLLLELHLHPSPKN